MPGGDICGKGSEVVSCEAGGEEVLGGPAEKRYEVRLGRAGPGLSRTPRSSCQVSGNEAPESSHVTSCVSVSRGTGSPKHVGSGPHGSTVKREVGGLGGVAAHKDKGGEGLGEAGGIGEWGDIRENELERECGIRHGVTEGAWH